MMMFVSHECTVCLKCVFRSSSMFGLYNCTWVCKRVGECVCVCVCMCEWVCECVCVCGCPGCLTGEVWAHNPEDTGSDPRAGGKFLYKKLKKVPPAHQLTHL